MAVDENLDSLCHAVVSGSPDSSLAAVRALRNLCAGSIENASHLVQTNLIQWIAKYCRETALLKSNFDDNGDDGEIYSPSQNSSSTAGNELYILALCQFLSNFAACGTYPSQFLWSPAFGENGESVKLRIHFILVLTVETS